MTNEDAMIRFEHVDKAFHGETIIKDFNIGIQAGELFVLVGTSGSGKTTTLKMINQLELPTAGQVFLNNVDIATMNLRNLRWDIGYVLQQIALFPTMTVAQNISVIPEMKGWNKQKIKSTVNQLLTQVGLNPKVYANRLPNELSGGEQQRIGILRAIAAQPKIVLMDEPFSALDPISRAQLQELVLALHQKMHNTIIFVTHDMNEAVKLGDRIGVMAKGKLLQVDTPSVIAAHPANSFIEEFFQTRSDKANVLTTTLEEVRVAGYLLTKEPTAKKGPHFDQSDTLGEVLAAFVNNTYVPVTANQEVVGYLTQQQLFAFLAVKYNEIIDAKNPNE